MPTDLEGDPQDQSEVFDEDNNSPDGVSAEYRTFEEMPDVLDVTQAEGDADDDDALIAEELDDDEIIELEADADTADIDDDDSDFDDEGGSALTREAAGEVELEYMGDVDAAPDIDGRDAAAMEADTLGDDDIEELGY